MRRATRWLTVALVASSSALWTGCAGRGQVNVGPEVLAKAGLQYYWTLSLDLDRGETIAWIQRIDENLYCLTNKNKLIALNASNGLMKWQLVVARPNATVFRPVHADGVSIGAQTGGIREILHPDKIKRLKPFDAVIINTLSKVLVIDRTTGQVHRDIPLDFAANTSVACDGQNIYAGSIKGWYYAIRIDAAVKDWWGAANDMITAPVVYFADRLYIADNSGLIFAVDVRHGGKKVWKRQLTGAVTAPFHVDGRGCFVASDGNRVYAFSLTDGRPLWSHPFVCQGPIRDATQVAANTIFQYARRDRFYAINIVTGRQRWSTPVGRKVLAVMDGEAYILSSAGNMLVADEVLGTIRTSLPMTGWDLFAANTTTPAIYVATGGGKLACIRKLSAGRLSPAELKAKP